VSLANEGKRQEGKTLEEQHKTQKRAKSNKGPCKKIAFTHVNKWIENGQISQKGMMIKK
jgi:hypothetical protein